jgi:hypothetical protein
VGAGGEAVTREDIIRIYNQVSDELCDGKEWAWTGVEEPLQRFAALVAAAEREAILEHCEAMRRAHTGYQMPSGLMQLIDAIRARGSK